MAVHVARRRVTVRSYESLVTCADVDWRLWWTRSGRGKSYLTFEHVARGRGVVFLEGVGVNNRAGYTGSESEKVGDGSSEITGD